MDPLELMLVFISTRFLFSFNCFFTGSVIGTSIFPGLGTIFGAVVGGIVGGHFGGHYSHVATENALNHVKWDVVTFVCDGCDEEYTWKKYQEIEGTCCECYSDKTILMENAFSKIISWYFFRYKIQQQEAGFRGLLVQKARNKS